MRGKNIILILVIAMILLSGCDQDKKVEAKKTIPVMTYEIHPEHISSYIKLTGGLEAVTDLDLYSMSSEMIASILVNEGDQVKKGELLVEQNSQIPQEGVKLALAGVNSARAQYSLIEKEFSRMEKLLKEKAVSQQQFDQVEMQKITAKAGLDLAEAQLQQAKENLNYTKIFAPADGEIAMIYFRTGQMVAAGSPVIKLINIEKMTARLKASEVDMSRFFIGQNVEAVFPALPDDKFTGMVSAIDKAINPVDRTLELKVILENDSQKLRSGLFGEFLLITDERKDVIVLSDAAVMTRTKLRIDNNGRQVTEKEYYVFVNRDSYAEIQTVKTGLHSFGRLEITQGLQTGDQVIVVGQNIVKQGDKVKVVK